MTQQSSTNCYQNQISCFLYVNAFFNLSKLISLNSFSETNIFSDNFFIHSSFEKQCFLNKVVDKIYHHL